MTFRAFKIILSVTGRPNFYVCHLYLALTTNLRRPSGLDPLLAAHRAVVLMTRVISGGGHGHEGERQQHAHHQGQQFLGTLHFYFLLMI
jgi:hypothetical protein